MTENFSRPVALTHIGITLNCSFQKTALDDGRRNAPFGMMLPNMSCQRDPTFSRVEPDDCLKTCTIQASWRCLFSIGHYHAFPANIYTLYRKSEITNSGYSKYTVSAGNAPLPLNHESSGYLVESGLCTACQLAGQPRFTNVERR